LKALLLALILPLSALAGDVASPDTSGTDVTPEPSVSSNLKLSYEFDGETSFVGKARTNFGAGDTGGVSELQTDERLIVSPQAGDGPLYRFGLAYQSYNFGFSKAAPLPDILQAGNLILDADFTIFNSVLIQLEADPGFYGDGRDTGFRDFNVPFTIGGSYITGADLQWVGGVSLDFDRQIPVIPAIGLRWAVNDNWVIDAILPTPRLEYDWSKELTLYLGGDFDDGTYRVDHGLGVALGRPRLSNAVVEYDEIRLGAGVNWKATKVFTFEIEGGYLPYREFDFHRADTHFSNDDGALYGRVSLNTQF
jgi:hypothetical protein